MKKMEKIIMQTKINYNFKTVLIIYNHIILNSNFLNW